MDNALLKAIGVGVGTFVVMMALLWGIAKFAGMPILSFPARTNAVALTPVPTPVFLR